MKNLNLLVSATWIAAFALSPLSARAESQTTEAPAADTTATDAEAHKPDAFDAPAEEDSTAKQEDGFGRDVLLVTFDREATSFKHLYFRAEDAKCEQFRTHYSGVSGLRLKAVYTTSDLKGIYPYKITTLPRSDQFGTIPVFSIYGADAACNVLPKTGIAKLELADNECGERQCTYVLRTVLLDSTSN